MAEAPDRARALAVSETLAALDAWLVSLPPRVRSALGRGVGPKTKHTQLHWAAGELGVRIPHDLRALYSWHNGQAYGGSFFDRVLACHTEACALDVAVADTIRKRTFLSLTALVRRGAITGERLERVLREAMSLIAPAMPSGSLEADLAALVQRRARVFEHITPFRRAARLVRHESAFLQEQDRMATTGLRAAMLGVLQPHLGSKSGDTIEALDLLLSFEAWERLRHQQKASVKRAQQILAAAALTLVKAAPTAAPKGNAR